MSVFQDDLAGYADDYVLGLLSPSEAQLFEALLATDPALDARVARMRDDLLPLDLSATPVDLSPEFRDRLRALIAATPQDPAPVPVPDSTPVAANDPAAPRMGRFRLAAMLVAGVALGMAGTLLQPAPQPQVVAVLLDDQGQPRAVIEDYGNDTAQIRFVSDIAVPQGSTIQAWTLPSAERGPVSLGTLDDSRPTLLTDGPDLPAPANAQLYEITLEPAGGSPTGRPTGPVIAKGLAAVQDI